MSAHQRRGAHAAALGAYEDLRRHLAADLGSDPSPSTREVFLAVLRPGRRRPSPGPSRRRPPPRNRRRSSGRESELAVLSRAWSAARPGPGRPGAGHRRGGDRQERAQRRRCAARPRRAGVSSRRCGARSAERSLYLAAARRGGARHRACAWRPGPVTCSRERERRALGDLVGGGGVAPGARPVALRAAPAAHARRDGGTVRPGRRDASRCCSPSRTSSTPGRRPSRRCTSWPTRLADPPGADRRHRADTSESAGAAATLRDVATVMDVGPLSRDALRALLAGAGREHDLERFVVLDRGLAAAGQRAAPAPRHRAAGGDAAATPTARPSPARCRTPCRAGSPPRPRTSRVLLAQAAVLGTLVHGSTTSPR